MLWFIALVLALVQQESTASNRGGAAKLALVQLLVFLLLAASLVSASRFLHGSIHVGDSTNEHFCMVCSFSKGSVTIEPAALGPALPPRPSLVGAFLVILSEPAWSGYLLSPCRAPPLVHSSNAA
jgi:hypothetical protein